MLMLHSNSSKFLILHYLICTFVFTSIIYYKKISEVKNNSSLIYNIIVMYNLIINIYIYND